MKLALTTKWKSAFAAVALVSISFGSYLAFKLAGEPIGYLASYTYLAILVFAGPVVFVLLLLGASLSISSRTRRFGIASATAGILIVAGYLGTFKILQKTGRVLYEHEKMVPIGPEVKSDLVIYFKHGTTNDQINNFWNNVLSTPDRDGRGSWPKPGVGDLGAVFPAVDGHEGVAVKFQESASQEEREQLKAAAGSSPLVFKIFENIAPADIKRID